MPGTRDGRAELEAEVCERAKHKTEEEVRTTCSFARAERLIGREYHGRFLIELLQNAADAWRQDPRAHAERSRVAVLLTEGPALVVANQGVPLTAETIISSFGHIGATTKAKGDAIGHKGIGFKSVLELSLTPEAYSGLLATPPTLAVSFDPIVALEAIRAATPGWADQVVRVAGVDPDDPLTAVPVLRYPRWVDKPPPEIGALRADGFDTAIRLPYDARFSDRLRLDEEAWLKTVRDGMDEISDEILLLLGTFGEVTVEDRIAGKSTHIVPEREELASIGEGIDREFVSVRRSGEISSSWRLYRRTLPDEPGLAGEVAVGLRIGESGPRSQVLPAVEGHPSAPFHLFFPTRIPSGFPFLFHGYFEVDAGRTGFYRGSVERNASILKQLADLTAAAVDDAARNDDIDLVSLVDLVAAAGDPEDALAADFRAEVLRRLDEVPWIPLKEPESGRGTQGACPAMIFVDRPDLTRSIAQVFPPAYLRDRIDLELPSQRLSDAALVLVAHRHDDRRNAWETLSLLCRPGSIGLWDEGEADQRFRALLDLVDVLNAVDRSRTRELFEGLAGDPESRLLPVVDESRHRAFLPVPDPSEATAGRRSQLVMARVRAAAGPTLVPPRDLGVAFVADGLLTSEDVERARPLGVRPFTVDNVLDRLGGLDPVAIDGEALLRFLWQLLARERVSFFGTRPSVERAGVFDPNAWFWCQPGRAREDEAARQRQQRERHLSEVPVPCRDGTWRPAGSVAFGADWGEWLVSSTPRQSPVTAQRANSYRALEKVCPGAHALLAPPAVVLALLDDGPFSSEVPGQDASEVVEVLRSRHPDAERHAFLLRLGVWEVPPIEAFEGRARRRERFPWTGQHAERQQHLIKGSGCRFGLEGWSGSRHNDVHLAEDYRFQWSLEAMAERSVIDLLEGLRAGVQVYRRRLHAVVFCPGCPDVGTRHKTYRESSAADGYPSILSLELRSERWIPASRDGAPLGRPVAPSDVWWHAKPPAGGGLRQSPWRLVPLCGPDNGVDETLRDLGRVNVLATAHLAAIGRLLRELREQLENGQLAIDPLSSGSARQALESLHRLAYDRLAELALESSDSVAKLLDETGVLCHVGDGLAYESPSAARHDDGRFAAYVRHFAGKIPFVALPRDRQTTVSRLGIRPLDVRLTRRGNEAGKDVSDEVRGMLGDRLAELLAIVVHHSLGGQTLELASREFEARASRLQQLRIVQVDHLVVDAAAEGTSHVVTMESEVYLDEGRSSRPTLYHPFSGDGWEDRLRRKLAPHLATVLENAAYAHTFALFLQADGVAGREELLLEMGISADDVAAVERQIGVVGVEERLRHERWFTAILELLGADANGIALDPAVLEPRLIEAGLAGEVAHVLVTVGGGERARRDLEPDAPLALLDRSAMQLGRLDARLRQLGDAGLVIGVARNRFKLWLSSWDRHLAAVLARSLTPKTAKDTVRALQPPAQLLLSLDPPLAGLLEPVSEALATAGLIADVNALAKDPLAELVRLGGISDRAELERSVRLLYDNEEQLRALHERAGFWRRELRLLGVLVRTGPSETRAGIRAIDESVSALLPVNPERPAILADVMTQLLPEHPELTGRLLEHLVDDLLGAVPERSQLLAWAREAGVCVERLSRVQEVLEAPRRTRVRRLQHRIAELADHRIQVRVPPGLLSVPPRTETVTGAGPKRVAAIKVDARLDRRKRELGDEGEEWALAAVLADLVRLDPDALDQAVGEIVELLRTRFSGPSAEAALAHAEPARSRNLDEEERIDALSGLLHVAQYSDAFGFDLLGWLRPQEGVPPRALCLEVKSASSQEFHLSRGEWQRAEDLAQSYGVLVVRRSGTGGRPAGMDLLLDPVALDGSGQLRRDADGYLVAYCAATA